MGHLQPIFRSKVAFGWLTWTVSKIVISLIEMTKSWQLQKFVKKGLLGSSFAEKGKYHHIFKLKIMSRRYCAKSHMKTKHETHNRPQHGFLLIKEWVGLSRGWGCHIELSVGKSISLAEFFDAGCSRVIFLGTYSFSNSFIRFFSWVFNVVLGLVSGSALDSTLSVATGVPL